MRGRICPGVRLVGACAGQNRCTKKNEVDVLAKIISAKIIYLIDDQSDIYDIESNFVVIVCAVVLCRFLLFVHVHARLIADSFSSFPFFGTHSRRRAGAAARIFRKLNFGAEEVKGSS